MLLVKGSVDEISAILRDSEYEIACMNSPDDTVLAGTTENLASFQALLNDAALNCTLLRVPYAFHSSQIDPILDEFKTAASGVTFSDPVIPIICPLSGSIVAAHSKGSFDAEYLANHSRQPVNMHKTLLTAHKEGILTSETTILEIGAHPSINHMVKTTLGAQLTLLATSRRTEPIWRVLGTALTSIYTAGANIRWAEYQRDFGMNHRVLSLPAYSWNLKDYWIPYTNDWALRNGDPPLITCSSLSPESTTIHRIVEEKGNDIKTTIINETDMARSDLKPLVGGYEIDGVRLCPPCIYAEIALSLGTYLLKK